MNRVVRMVRISESGSVPKKRGGSGTVPESDKHNDKYLLENGMLEVRLILVLARSRVRSAPKLLVLPATCSQ